MERTQPKDEVRKQITLPLSKAFSICMRGIAIRLGRASITAAGVFLGMAFLMSVVTSAMVQQAVERERQQLMETGEVSSQESQSRVGSSKLKWWESVVEWFVLMEPRMKWLVGMSLLVCAVGVTNSMFMSVTERFREIGTMKCLGALDSLVVRLFLIESGLLGFLGSLAGSITGFVIMILVSMIREGWGVLGILDYRLLPVIFVIALIIGTLLSIIATIPPALRAAKLPPAAALRTEI